MRIGRVFRQAGQGLRRNLTMTIAGVLTVMISLALLAGALIVHTGTANVKNGFLNQLNVSVYLDNDITSAQLGTIQTALHQLSQVESVTYISQPQAYSRFKNYYADEPDFVKLIKPSEVPASLVVKLHDPREFSVVDSAVGELPGVSNVYDASDALKRVFSFLHIITLAALVLALVALLATALLIYNAMQVSAFSRRRETGIMRLVGANDLSIQLPFVLEGTTIGLIGGGLAAVLLVPAWLFIKHNIAIGVFSPFAKFGIYGGVMPIIIAVGVAVSAVMSFLTLQRHLRV